MKNKNLAILTALCVVISIKSVFAMNLPEDKDTQNTPAVQTSRKWPPIPSARLRKDPAEGNERGALPSPTSPSPKGSPRLGRELITLPTKSQVKQRKSSTPSPRITRSKDSSARERTPSPSLNPQDERFVSPKEVKWDREQTAPRSRSNSASQEGSREDLLKPAEEKRDFAPRRLRPTAQSSPLSEDDALSPRNNAHFSKIDDSNP